MLQLIQNDGAYYILKDFNENTRIPLFKENSYVTNECFNIGWKPVNVIELQDGWMALTFENEKGDDGVWYFDPSGGFCGNSLETFTDGFVILSKYKNQLLHETIMHLFNPHTPDGLEFKKSLLNINTSLINDVSKTILNGIRLQKFNLYEKELAEGELAQTFRELTTKPAGYFQDEILQNTKLSVALSGTGTTLVTDKTLVLQEFIIAFPFVCSDGRVLLLFFSDHLNIPVALYSPFESVYLFIEDFPFGPEVLISILFKHIVKYFTPLQLTYLNLQNM